MKNIFIKTYICSKCFNHKFLFYKKDLIEYEIYCYKCININNPTIFVLDNIFQDLNICSHKLQLYYNILQRHYILNCKTCKTNLLIQNCREKKLINE